MYTAKTLDSRKLPLIIDRQSRVVGTPFLDLVEVENLVGVGILQLKVG